MNSGGALEQAIRAWAGEAAIVRYDPPAGAWLIIALHSLALGPAAGGTRMKAYASLEDAFKDAARLSEGMTLKYSVHGFPRGGGKAVIAVPEHLTPDERTSLLRRHGEMIRALAGTYYAGPDIGTSPDDMDILAEVAGRFVHCTTPDRGGAGDSAPPTALGVFTGIRVACEHRFGTGDLRGRSVLVQGAGSVGGILIGLLLDAGASVMFSDVSAAAVVRYRDELGVPFVAPGAVSQTPCDVFAPCALGGILNETTIPQLRCNVVAGAANNQLATLDDSERLRRRGILYAPDFVLNIGGAMAITGIEALGWSRDEANRRVVATIETTLRQVFDLARTAGLPSDAAARGLARERIDAALSESAGRTGRFERQMHDEG